MTIEVTNETDLGTLMFMIPPTGVAYQQWQATCEARAEEGYELGQLEEAYHKLAYQRRATPRIGVPWAHAAWMFAMSFVLGISLCLLWK